MEYDGTNLKPYMQASKSRADWNARCDKVKAYHAEDGRPTYPANWYAEIVMGGVAAEARATW
jgi:hypothetical protein